MLTSPNAAFIRFADVKHTAKEGQLENADDSFCELVNKAHEVHVKLTPLLRQAHDIQLSDFSPVHVALATNRKETIVSLPEWNGSGTVKNKYAQRKDDVQRGYANNEARGFVFAPDTFVLEPWTLFLFSDVLIEPKPQAQ